MTFDYNKFFPFEEERIEQTKSINFTLDAFLDKRKRFVVLENPVGSGKSGIAITVAKYLSDKYRENGLYSQGSYIITTQKILQTQYANEFDFACNIWSKSNYRCTQTPKVEMSCELGQWLNSFSRTEKGKVIYNSNCPYKIDKKKFIDGDIGITNTQFLLNNIMYTDEIKRRNLLVVDECHTLESAIIEFVSMNFDGPMIEQELEINWMHCTENTKSENFVDWIKDIYVPAMKFKMSEIENKLKKIKDSSKINSSHHQLLKKYEEYDRLICHNSRCTLNFDPKNWVMSVDVNMQKVTIKPIFASLFSEWALFRCAEKILLMSGTILDKEIFCRNLGIKIEDCEFLSVDSSFPIENRPIIVLPVGSMNYKNIKETLPNLVMAIKELLKNHKNEKGIIHCHTYSNAKYIFDNIKDKRLLIHTSKTRDEILKQHIDSSDDTVILSPSFTEGIDLYEDLSRWQVICKVPYPYLGDKYVKEKMSRIKNWYEWETAKTIIQGSGRSVRSKTDTAVTYILDSEFNNFFNKNNNLFPKWWKDAIQKYD